MLAIWRAVQEQIHVHGAKSVRQACDQLFNRRAKGLIKFTDKAGNVIDKIDDDAGGNATTPLKKRESSLRSTPCWLRAPLSWPKSCPAPTNA